MWEKYLYRVFVSSWSNSKKVKGHDLSIFCRQFAKTNCITGRHIFIQARGRKRWLAAGAAMPPPSQVLSISQQWRGSGSSIWESSWIRIRIEAVDLDQGSKNSMKMYQKGAKKLGKNNLNYKFLLKSKRWHFYNVLVHMDPDSYWGRFGSRIIRITANADPHLCLTDLLKPFQAPKK